MNYLQKFFGHLSTVHKHRKEVRKLCFQCGLYWQGLTHDLSKYSPVEFWNGVKYFTGTASPHVGERQEKGFSEAWVHHHNRNKHHAEYWQDIRNGKHCSIPMPEKYLYEMVCDRVAASKIYLKDKYDDSKPLEYLINNIDENQFHIITLNKLKIHLEIIAEKGFKFYSKAIKELLI